MENIIHTLIKEKEISANQIIQILDEVCKNKDVMIIKSDGLRDSSKYTAVITSSKEGFESIRFDGETLSEAVLKVLKEYVLSIIKQKSSDIQKRTTNA